MEIAGIDIDIRAHNRNEIEKHPISKRIRLIEESSINIEVFDKIIERMSTKDFHNTSYQLHQQSYQNQDLIRELNL